MNVRLLKNFSIFIFMSPKMKFKYKVKSQNLRIMEYFRGPNGSLKNVPQ